MRLYHGTLSETLTIRDGLCLTPSPDSAARYATEDGSVYELDIDLTDLAVADVAGYDHDTNDCPADHAEYRAARASEGVDVVRYADEDEYGTEHECYRLVSDRVAVRVVARLTWDDDDMDWS